jgi:hypothetical protein
MNAVDNQGYTICPADNATAGCLGRRRAGQLRFGFVAVLKGHIVYAMAMAYTTMQCVCLKNCLCMLYDSGSLGRPWAQFWTTIGPTVDLSKSASRTRKNVLKKQISCLCES